MGAVRPSVHRLAVVLGCVAFAVAVVAAGPRLWLRTSYGHRTVERVLTRILDERVPGFVSVGRLDGDVLTGLHATNVVVRNPEGAIIAQARSITARWRPLALLRRHELEAVEVEEPVIAIDRARWRAPPPKARPPAHPRETVIHLISARNGRLTVRQTKFTRVSGTATLHGSSHLDVHGVSGRVAGNVLYAYGIVGWGRRPTWVATRFAVDRPRRMHGAGELLYTRGHFEAELESLAIAAPVATRLVGGRGPLQVHGRVETSDTRLRGVAGAAQGRRSLHLGVSIDRVAHRAVLDGRLDGAARPIRLHVRARYRPREIFVSSLRATVGDSGIDARGSLAPRRLHVALRLRLAPAEARLLSLQPTAPIVAQLRADGPTRALRVHGRAQEKAAQLLFAGRLNLPSRSGALDLVARAVVPRQLAPGAPALRISTRAAVTAALARHALVGHVRVTGGSVELGGHRLDDVDADAEVQLARQGAVTLHRLGARWRHHAVAARGTLRWNRRQLDVTDADLDVAGAHAHADARYQRDARHLTVRAAPVSLSPAWVSRILHRPFPRPWTGRVTLAGRRGDFTLAAEARTLAGPLRVTAHVLRAGADLNVPHLEAALGASHLYGALHYQAGRVSASIAELLLAPSLVHQLVPQLTPAWPIRLHGTIAGQQLLALSLALEAGPSTAQLRGRIAARQFLLAAHFDHFDLTVLRPSTKRVRASFNLAASGRFAKGGVVGTLTLADARGYILESPFFRGMADARLDGRGVTLTSASVRLPGAKVMADGHGAFGQGFTLDFGVVVTNALALRQVPKGLRTMVGINSMLPGRSVEGTISKQPGHNVEVKYMVLPIGISQLEFLWRVLTGRIGWSERRL